MRIRLLGVTGRERHAVVSAVSDAIVAVRGYVLDFHQFSNKGVQLTLELPPNGYTRLRVALERLGVALDPETADEAAFLAGACGCMMLPGSLRIDFHHEEPDLRVTIPMVPG